MSFNELAKSRYSARSFKAQPVEQDKLNAILGAGMLAPTACNNQPQRIKVIDSQEELKKLDECTRFRFEAPLVLLICYDRTQVWKRRYDDADSGEIDASIVTTHIMLEAQEQGLGSCWVMLFEPEKLREKLDLPEDIIPVALLPMGYVTDDCQPNPLHSKSKSLEEILI